VVGEDQQLHEETAKGRPGLERPEGWAFPRISDILTVNYGKGLKKSSRKTGTVPVYGSNGLVGRHNNALTEGPTIILGRKGTVGAVNFSTVPCWPIDTTYFIDKFNGLVPGFIFHAMRSLNLGELDTSTAIPGLNRNDIYKQQIPLPPIPEQKRIVAKIEELLARVIVARERLAKVKGILKRFRQSVLAAACSGRLTEDWRVKSNSVEDAGILLARIRESFHRKGASHGGKAAAPTEGIHELAREQIPESWDAAALKWLCSPGRPITYGILKPGPHQGDGVPYIRVADFPKNYLEQSTIRKTSKAIAAQYERSSLKAGDVLLSIRGTVGRVCRLPRSLEGSNITQDTARISVHPEVCPEYVEIYLKSPIAQKTLEKAMKGVAVRGVNIGDVRALQVAIPPRTEQQEIVRRVEALFNLADQIEKRVVAAGERAEKLTEAIVAKAFRGELVLTEASLARREGRSYEPASELLAKIRERSRKPQRNPTESKKFKTK
jgi:type I restriction enzyme S subunit